VIGDRVAARREIVVSSVLILIRAPLIAITRRLVVIRPRLILVARRLVALRDRPITRRRVATTSRALADLVN
jgi:hypothetical protein